MNFANENNEKSSSLWNRGNKLHTEDLSLKLLDKTTGELPWNIAHWTVNSLSLNYCGRGGEGQQDGKSLVIDLRGSIIMWEMIGRL